MSLGERYRLSAHSDDSGTLGLCMADPPLPSEPISEDKEETLVPSMAFGMEPLALAPTMATATTFPLLHFPKPYSNSILHTCHHDGRHE